MSRQKILEISSWQIGVKETPPNSNNNPYGLRYNINMVAWCALFVSWIYEQADHSLGHVDSANPSLNGFAYVPTALNHWRTNGKITTDPKPGDLVIYDWQKGKTNETTQEKLVDHVGIFEKWLDKSAGTFTTIEGNTSVANDSNGGSVMRRQRNMSFVEAFVNPLDLPV